MLAATAAGHGGTLLLIAVVGWITLLDAAAEVAAPSPQSAWTPLRDGKSLAADLYLPAAAGRYPTILILTPYDRVRMRERLVGEEKLIFDPEHYAYVVADWRGHFGSKDAAVGPKKNSLAQLGQDGFDTVEWIARQDWSDGRVGMWGPSALGRVQFQTAAERPLHLVCIVPLVAQFGYSYSQFYQGGVLKKSYLEGIGKVGFSPQTGLLAAHPAPDAFWGLIEGASQPGRIDVPVLMIGGWYDLHTDGVIETFRGLRSGGGPTARRNTWLILGPWHHTAMGHLNAGELQFPEAEDIPGKDAKAFFDFWLRDIRESEWEETPPVQYFQMGENRWESAQAWPPAETRPATWFLDGEGRLSPEKPIESGIDSFRYDPRDPSPTVGGMNLSFLELSAATPERTARLKDSIRAGPMDQRQRVESRPDAVVYTSLPLERGLPVLGNVRVELHVSSDCPDTDFAVRLCDVLPDGRSMLVTDGIQRMKYRGAAQDSLEPGKVYAVRIGLAVTATTFLRGHRLRVIITSSNAPRFEPNSNSGPGPAPAGDVRVATNSILHGPEYASSITLPLRSIPPAERGESKRKDP